MRVVQQICYTNFSGKSNKFYGKYKMDVGRTVCAGTATARERKATQ